MLHQSTLSLLLPPEHIRKISFVFLLIEIFLLLSSCMAYEFLNYWSLLICLFHLKNGIHFSVSWVVFCIFLFFHCCILSNYILVLAFDVVLVCVSRRKLRTGSLVLPLSARLKKWVTLRICLACVGDKFSIVLFKKAARVEVNISLAFLHWVRITFHPWPFVSDIAIFVLKRVR